MASGVSTWDIYALTNLNALRYLSIAGTTVLAYDTILTLPEEIYYVWIPLLSWRRRKIPGRRGFDLLLVPRILSLFIRYVMLSIASVYLMTLMPLHKRSDAWCKLAMSTVSRIDVFIEIIGSGIVLQRLHLLWGFERRGTILLISGFIIMKSLSLTFGMLMNVEIRNSISFSEDLHGSMASCVINKTSRPFGLASWILAAACDVFAFFLLLLNALSRPRAESQKLLDIIYSDGLVYFLTTFSMRMMNVLFSGLSKEASLFFMATVFSGTMVTVAATRSFLRLFQFSRRDSQWITESDVGTVSGYDQCTCSTYNDHHMLVPGEEAVVHEYDCGIDNSDIMRLEEPRTKKDVAQ